MRPWIAFFSQTGTEIYDLSNALGVYPDCVILNKHNTDGVNKKLIELTTFRATKLNMTHCWCHIPPKPELIDYKNVLSLEISSKLLYYAEMSKFDFIKLFGTQTNFLKPSSFMRGNEIQKTAADIFDAYQNKIKILNRIRGKSMEFLEL